MFNGKLDLQNDDPKFFQKLTLNLINVQKLYIKPMLGNVLHAHVKVHGIHASIAEQFVPVLLTAKDKSIQDNVDLATSTKELKYALEKLDTALFVQPLMEYDLKHI